MNERIYTTVDKSGWGDGPWQSEPDKVQFKDAATGLACLVKRNRLGAWCGYVGVPPDHPFYEVDYSDVEPDPEVHGGLTYSNHCAEGPEESSICHVPNPGEPDNVWWLGFDCAHSGDVVPGMVALERGLFSPTYRDPWSAYRDLAYVRRQVTKLAAQLAQPHHSALGEHLAESRAMEAWEEAKGERA